MGSCGPYAGPTRRRALAAGAAVLVSAGCGLRLETPAPRATPAPTFTPGIDQVARARVAAAAEALAREVAALAQARPELQGALSVLLTDHRAHAAAARSGAGATPTPAPTTAATTTPATTRPTATATGTPDVATPPGPAVTVARLLEAERSAATAAVGDLAVVGPSTARLLASVAASLQVHVAVLGALV